MPLTIGDLRRAIAGRPDDEEIGVYLTADEVVFNSWDVVDRVELIGTQQNTKGKLLIEVMLASDQADDESEDA